MGACVVLLGEEEGEEGEGEGGDEGESGEEEGEDGGMLVVHFRCVEKDQKIGRVGEDGGRSLAKVVMHVEFQAWKKRGGKQGSACAVIVCGTLWY